MHHFGTARCIGLLAGLMFVAAAGRAGAQALPEAPISLAGGHMVVGAEITATIAPDDPGFFNYTSYEYSALNNLRVGVSVELRANDRVQVLGEARLDVELRSDDRPPGSGEVRPDRGDMLKAYGLFLRVRPWPARRFDIQAGRIPPTFGALTRSAYGSSNLLIGQPLAYQYLLSIRPDALPATNDDLTRMRARGWLSSFQIGNTSPAPGLPIVNTNEWDTGVQVHGVVKAIEWTGSVSAGSLSDPRLSDNNGGRQLAGRVVARPTPAFAIGVSASRGAWLDRHIDDARTGASAGDRSRQIAFGGDLEFSAGPVLVRGEAIRSSWSLPEMPRLRLDEPLVATSMLIEGRYRVAPGWVIALRGDRLDFSTISTARGPTTWEAATWRTEAGIGYSLTRNIQLKGSWQRNGRDGGRIRRDSLAAAQVLYWF